MLDGEGLAGSGEARAILLARPPRMRTSPRRPGRDLELLRMRDAEKCAARRVIDAAAAVALGVSEAEIADWRRRLAAEPTVTNVRAPGSGKGGERT